MCCRSVYKDQYGSVLTLHRHAPTLLQKLSRLYQITPRWLLIFVLCVIPIFPSSYSSPTGSWGKLSNTPLEQSSNLTPSFRHASHYFTHLVKHSPSLGPLRLRCCSNKGLNRCTFFIFGKLLRESLQKMASLLRWTKVCTEGLWRCTLQGRRVHASVQADVLDVVV